MLWKISGALIGALIVLWLVVTVVGFVVKGLIWLGFIGLVLAAGTVVYGAVKGRGGKGLPRY